MRRGCLYGGPMAALSTGQVGSSVSARHWVNRLVMRALLLDRVLPPRTAPQFQVQSLEGRQLLAATPAFELYRDAAATQPLLNAVYANVTEAQIWGPSKDYIADDLRAAPGIAVTGQRVDA